MKPGTALGHMAGKLATVLYGCLKTMTPYDGKKHLQHMGMKRETETSKTLPVEVTSEVIDKNEFQNDTSLTVTT